MTSFISSQMKEETKRVSETSDMFCFRRNERRGNVMGSTCRPILYFGNAYVIMNYAKWLQYLHSKSRELE